MALRLVVFAAGAATLARSWYLCKSCHDTYCQYDRDYCSVAELGNYGQCVWNADAPRGKQCSCWNRNYVTYKCYDGKVKRVTYVDVDYGVFGPGSRDKIASTEPTAGYDLCDRSDHWGESMIRRTCTGTDYDSFPMQRYYSDTNCETEIPERARVSNWEEVTTCIGHVEAWNVYGFEKFACDRAGGGVIAREYEDSACTTPTGNFSERRSPTDGDLNQCIAYPLGIWPDGGSQIRFSCPGGHLMYEAWSKADGCASEPDRILNGSNCVVQGRFRFSHRVELDYLTLAGGVTLHVDDVQSALANSSTLLDYMNLAVAQTAGVPPWAIADLELSVGRRLSESNRRLQEGEVVVTYKVVVPKGRSDAVFWALTAVTVAKINAILFQKPALGFTFRATKVGAVTEASMSARSTSSASAKKLATTGDALAHAPGLAVAMLVVAAAAA